MTFLSTLHNATSSAVRTHFLSAVSVLSLLVGVGSALPALATPITLTFDEYADETYVSTKYQSVGVTATNAQIIIGFATIWLADTAPNIALSVFNPDMGFVLNTAITGNIQNVSAYIYGLTSVGLYAYDAADVLLGQALTPGATSGMAISFTSSGNPIARIAIHDAGAAFCCGGFDFGIDTLKFATAADVATVPEPATAWLLGLGLLGWLGVARRKSNS